MHVKEEHRKYTCVKYQVRISPLDGSNKVKFYVPVPQPIHDYFYNARSIDIVGQLRYTYPLGRKARRQYPSLIWWLIDICIVNAFTIASMNDDRLTHLSFREDLMYALTKQRRDELKVSAESAATNSGVSLAKDHYIIHSNIERRCQYCSVGEGIRTETRYVCNACQVHLCLGACFAAYHS